MSRFVLGNCIDVMARIPDNAIDFILTDPPYLVGFRDRSGRTIAGDVNDDWLQPASNEMYRVLKRRADGQLLRLEPCRSLYGRPKRAGFSVAGHLVFTKTTHPNLRMSRTVTNALTSRQRAVRPGP